MTIKLPHFKGGKKGTMYQPKGTKHAHIKLQTTVDIGINCLAPQLSAQCSLHEIPDLKDYLYFACS